MDQTGALAQDMLGNILRRLPACDLAASRCVRKTWRAIVDARGLLLLHVLPHSVRGIFVNYIDYQRPHCFSRPSAQKPAINGNLDFLPGYTQNFNQILDHCNGLVLYKSFSQLYVVNPATRQWDSFDSLECEYYDSCNPYLAFDPAISPHYEVFSIPDVPKKVAPHEQEDPHDSMEWPPSLWILDVFSSTARQWQKRSFLRQGEAMGTVTSVRVDSWRPKSMCFGGSRRRYGVCWGGSLYVHCRGAFVARFCLSSGKYQVIKLPRDIRESKNSQFLGKSEKGVSLATIHDKLRLRLFNLVESDGKVDWVLKHHVNLEPVTSLMLHNFEGFKKTWTLDDGADVMMMKKKTIDWGGGDGKEDKGRVNEGMLTGDNLEWNSDDEDYEDDDENDNDNEDDDDDDDDDDDEEEEYEDDDDDYDEGGKGDEDDEMQMTENMEWDYDDDNVLTIEDDYSRCGTNLYFLGFHPYKAVVFLGLSSPFIGVAYHLRSSKIQYLGKMRPKDYYNAHTNGMYEAYPYTPCRIGELQNQASTSHRRS